MEIDMHRFKSCLDSNAGPTGRQAEDMEKTFDVSFAGLNKSATLREIVDTLRCLVAFRNDQVPFSFNNWMLFAVGKSQQHSTFQSIHYLNENLVFLVTIESDLTKDTYIATALASSTCTSATFKRLDWIRTRVESPDFLPADEEKLIKIYSHTIEIPKNAVEKQTTKCIISIFSAFLGIVNDDTWWVTKCDVSIEGSEMAGVDGDVWIPDLPQSFSHLHYSNQSRNVKEQSW